MRLRTRILIVTVLTAAFLVRPLFTSAQDPGEETTYQPSLTIYPSIIDLDVTPGKQLKESITIENNTVEPIPVTIEVLNYSTDQFGYPSYTDDPVEGWSPISWITVEPTDLIVEPANPREISLSIHIHEEARSGSHLGTIMFKPVLPPDYFTPHSAHVIPYIGSIIALNVRTGEEESVTDFINIKQFTADTETEEEIDVGYTALIENKDVYYHRVTGNIDVFNIFNKLVLQKEVDSTTILPEKESYITGTLAEELSFGRYRAEFTIREENAIDTEIVEFWVSPTILEIIQIVFVLVLMIATFGFIYLLIFRRENVKKSLKVIFPGKQPYGSL